MIALGSRIGGVWRVSIGGKRGTWSTLAKAIESAK